MRPGTYSVRLALALRPVLREAYGRAWPIALARCFVRARRLVLRTRWGTRRDEEARHVRALAVVPAACLELGTREGGRGAHVVNELSRAVLGVELARLEREAQLGRITDARERWHAFFECGLLHGLRSFDENECVSLHEDRFHVRVLRCLFTELAAETGVPELAEALCAAHEEFYASLLPAFEFQRARSNAGTAARGPWCCEYVWQRRTPAPRVAGSRAEGARAEHQAPAGPSDPPGAAAALSL